MPTTRSARAAPAAKKQKQEEEPISAATKSKSATKKPAAKSQTRKETGKKDTSGQEQGQVDVQRVLAFLNDDGDKKTTKSKGADHHVVCTAQGIAKLVARLGTRANGSASAGTKRALAPDADGAELRNALASIERLTYRPVKPYLVPEPSAPSGQPLFPNLRQLQIDPSAYEPDEDWEDEEEEAKYLPVKAFVNLVGTVRARHVCYTIVEDKEKE